MYVHEEAAPPLIKGGSKPKFTALAAQTLDVDILVSIGIRTVCHVGQIRKIAGEG